MGASARQLDFSKVKDGGNFNKKRVPAGDYLATVTKVEDAKAKGDGVAQYLFTIKLQKYPSAVYPYYVKLQENQLWKLRNLLIAAGKSVPKSKMKVDPNQIVGKLIGVSMSDTEYEDKEQSEVDGVFPAADLADDPSQAPVDDDSDEATEDADDDDAPLDESYDEGDEDTEAEPEEDEAEVETEEEAEEEVAADPYADLDRAALKRELKKIDPDFKAKTSQTDDDLRAMLAAANGDSDEDEVEEEEPEPAPVKRVAKKKPAAKDVSDDELDELDIDKI